MACYQLTEHSDGGGFCGKRMWALLQIPFYSRFGQFHKPFGRGWRSGGDWYGKEFILENIVKHAYMIVVKVRNKHAYKSAFPRGIHFFRGRSAMG